MAIAIFAKPRIVMSMHIPVKADIAWHATRLPSGRWIGSCESMRLAMQGNSLDELNARIEEALQAVLLDVALCNEWDAYFGELGIPVSPLPALPITRDAYFDAPWLLVVENHYNRMRKAD
jgi:hypothetical protein